MTDSQWRRIFLALNRDILDRRGLKHEWRQIHASVKIGEIYPAWRKIVERELETATKIGEK